MKIQKTLIYVVMGEHMLDTDNVWTEKLRPQTLSEIKGQEAIPVLQSFVRHQNVIDCILPGPPGCGKTTALKALARDLYGVEKNEYGTSYYEANFKLLNASDDNSIATIRTSVVNFAGSSPTHPTIGFKIIGFDEAERLSDASQDALRGIIEQYSKNCRFVFTCNNLNGLTEALQSRGPAIPFYRLDDSIIKENILKICTIQNMRIEEDALNLLIQNARGDMRKVIKNLQIASMLVTVPAQKEPGIITLESIRKFISQIDDKFTEKLVDLIFEKDFSSARALLIDIFAQSHYNAEAVLSSIDRVISKSVDKFDNTMAFMKVQMKIGDTAAIITKSQYPIYNLMSLIFNIMLINQIPINCIHIKE